MWPVVSALIIFTSDNPEKFQYFSDSFVKKINESRQIHVIQDKNLETQFYLNIEKKRESERFKEVLFHNIQVLKSYIKNNEFILAEQYSQKAYKEFVVNLEKYPQKIERKTLIEFYFWNLASRLTTQKHIQDSTQEILDKLTSLISLSEKIALQNKLSTENSIEFENFFNSYKGILKKKYTVKNTNKCEFFLDGQPLKLEKTDFNAFSHSIFGARCEDGKFTAKLSSASNIITIKPFINKIVPNKPAVSLFPTALIQTKQVQSIIFIHWSTSQNSIYTTVVDLNHKNQQHQFKLDLTSDEARKSTGDKIQQFIFRQRKTLLE